MGLLPSGATVGTRSYNDPPDSIRVWAEKTATWCLVGNGDWIAWEPDPIEAAVFEASYDNKPPR